LNGHREFIEKYSETFALFVKKGCNVITFDWRGWGLSERPFPYQPKIQHISSAAEYQLDLDEVISLAKQKNLAQPWHLIAHSLGCLLGLRRLILEPECFDKYIFLSPLWGNLHSLQIPLQRFLLRSEKILQFLNLTKVTNQNPKKYTPYSLTVDFRKNTLTSDKKQFQRLQTILKNNPELHSGAPTLGYLIAMLKEIDSLNRVDLPNRDMLVLLAEQERITDNKAVMRLIRRYDFINVVKINKAQHEILIEKETIRKKAMSLIHNFIDS
jgi:lysophospholipase